MSFGARDPVWSALAALEAEPSGTFNRLVAAARLNPAVDFRGADLTNLPLWGADLSGFDFSGADLRGTGLRFAACTNDMIIFNAKLDRADKNWLQRQINGKHRLRSKAPRDFNEETAVDLILVGKPVPMAWKPWIRRLDFSIDRRSPRSMTQPIHDLSPLADFKNLSLLIIPTSKIEDLSPLSELVNLSWLWIANTKISNLSPLAKLQNLSTLWLAGTDISDLGPLSSISSLSWLNISRTKTRDISPISELTNLSWLNISYTSVKNLKPLSKLKKLWMLKIIENGTRDFSPLRSMPDLSFIMINNLDRKQRLETIQINTKVRIILSSSD